MLDEGVCELMGERYTQTTVRQIVAAPRQTFTHFMQFFELGGQDGHGTSFTFFDESRRAEGG